MWHFNILDKQTKTQQQPNKPCPQFSPSDVMQKGLDYIGIGREQQGKMSVEVKVKDFKAHYGSSPLVSRHCWYLAWPVPYLNQRGSSWGEGKIWEGLQAVHACPFSSLVVSKEHQPHDDSIQNLQALSGSKESWYWPTKIGALKGKKIVWSLDLNRNATAIIALSVDGVNYRTWEKNHPTFNKDSGFFDHKHNSCGLKYEIGLMIYEPKIAWIKGPIRCGKGDRDVFRDDGLKEKLGSTPGKMGIADSGYELGKAEDMGFFMYS